MNMRFRVPLATSEPVEISTPARERIEAAIQRHLDTAGALIALLDRTDGDPDLEPDHDGEPDADSEPSLGWTIGGIFAGLDDLEIGHAPVEGE
jgi:hypothetical protein